MLVDYLRRWMDVSRDLWLVRDHKPLGPCRWGFLLRVRHIGGVGPAARQGEELAVCCTCVVDTVQSDCMLYIQRGKDRHA